jgi:hypothetical protein
MTEQSKALSVIKPQALTPDIWQMIRDVAPAMHAARWFSVSNPEQAMAIMLKGHELGLGLAASFEFIKPVLSRPCLTPMGALALIQNSPLIAEMEIKDLTDDQGRPTGCRVRMKRSSGFEYQCTFTEDDAKRAGLIKPDSGYEKYPANMYRWRAIGFCADVVCPDVLGGLKRADEMGATISPDGQVIEAAWKPVAPAAAEQQAAPAPAITAPAVSIISLDDLLAKHGAEAIIAANEGRIPGMDAEIEAVAIKLEQGNG